MALAAVAVSAGSALQYLRSGPVVVVVALVALLAGVVAGWELVVRRGRMWVAGAGGVTAAVMVLGVVVTDRSQDLWALAVAVGSAVVAVGASRLALGRSRQAHHVRRGWRPAPPADRPVLLVNPRSGDGVAEQVGLADEATQRGIEVVLLEPDSDLRALATTAVEAGADVIGMAGGDGSQAIVADVAAEHDVAFVCVPAGTRNHFALDLGLDRTDPLGALDAFGPALERRIDVGHVNGRAFVNNVSLGVYAEVIQSDSYRSHKVSTVAEALPEMLGPDAEPIGLRFDGPDGRAWAAAHVVQVSNNPYRFDRVRAMGSRPRLDGGVLGLVALEVVGGAFDVSRFVALLATGRAERYQGFAAWVTASFVLDADGPVAAGVDGEAVELDPPLRFTVRPGALRARIPTTAPGVSPAALEPHRHGTLIANLARTATRRS